MTRRGRARRGEGATLWRVYEALFEHYGAQHWWPGETPFEVMVGAVLTQNAAWSNVERAIRALDEADCLEPRAILASSPERLAELIRSSGYFNVKARRLRALCAWLVDRGGPRALGRVETATLRGELLAVHGVGPETADDILLYACERPVFVVDAYTRRLFERLGLVPPGLGYEALRAAFEGALPADVALFNEYHALIVRHAKQVCRRRPECAACCLAASCLVASRRAGRAAQAQLS